MKPVELSKRLKCIADMVTFGNSVVDVGCDHGFLSIYLVEQGICVGAKAMDVRPGPLNAAKTHVREYDLEDKIDCILSDGLHNADIPEKNTSLVIAGMGGPLILRILSECPMIRDAFDELILSPQSQIEEFRMGIRNQGLIILDEMMVYEDGKYYTCVKCIPQEKIECVEAKDIKNITTGIRGELADRYGAFLLAKKDEVLLKYLEYEKDILSDVCSHLDSNSHAARYEEILEKIRLNKEAIELCISID